MKLTGVKADLYDGARATLPAWVAAHVILILVGVTIDPTGPLSPLFHWDTRWYLHIANGMAHGGNVFLPGDRLVHFFPLTSAIVAGISIVTRLPVSWVLFGFCWALALVFGALVHMTVMREVRDPDVDRRTTAVRAAWLSQLAPGAFALAMGYTEPLAGVLAVSYFLAVRRQRTGWAFAFGLLAGISRPTGLILVLPGFIEAVRAARAANWSPRALAAGAASTSAPVLGLGTYLAFCRIHFHHGLLPFTQQMGENNRGSVAVDPIHTVRLLLRAWRGHHVSDLILYQQAGAILVTSILCAAICAAGLVGARKRLPASYMAWAAVMFVLSVTSPVFTSEPRYLAAIFPACIGLPLLFRRRAHWYAVLACNVGLLVWAGWLALGDHQIA